MIATVALAPEALVDPALGTALPILRGVHTALLERIAAHAAIVEGSGEEISELLKSIERLPVELKPKWKTLLTEFYKTQRFAPMNPPRTSRIGDNHTAAELADLAGRIDLMVVPLSQASELGAGPDGLGALLANDIEVAAIPAALYCNTLHRLASLAELGLVPHGTPREQFWNDVLRAPLRLSRTITVLDRYLFRGLAHHYDNLPASRNWMPEAIVWLLRHLDADRGPDAVPTTVTLIADSSLSSGFGSADTAAAAIREFWQRTPDGTVKDVEVRLGPWKLPGGGLLPHDRHIRSNIGVGFKIFAGLDRLGQQTVTDTDGMSWQYIHAAAAVKSLQAAETRSIGSAGMSCALV